MAPLGLTSGQRVRCHHHSERREAGEEHPVSRISQGHLKNVPAAGIKT